MGMKANSPYQPQAPQQSSQYQPLQSNAYHAQQQQQQQHGSAYQPLAYQVTQPGYQQHAQGLTLSPALGGLAPGLSLYGAPGQANNAGGLTQQPQGAAAYMMSLPGLSASKAAANLTRKS